MLIVIPVGPSDAANLHLLTQAITRLGVVETPVLIVSVPSLRAEAEAAAATLNANVSITDDEFDHGWPVGPDRMFIWTIRHLAEIQNDQPWLWLEPDAPPVKSRWDVLLADDYRAAGKPYYGFVRPTAWRDAEGNLTPVEGDNMLLGVAIYPPDMHKDKELLPLLNDLSLPRPSHPDSPWDIYLRWHFFRRGVHSTTLIYDRWRTCNYTRGEFDEILCEPVACERGAVGGAIPDEAVIVHGCKDGSLHRLVIGEPPAFAGTKPSPMGEWLIEETMKNPATKLKDSAKQELVEQHLKKENAFVFDEMQFIQKPLEVAAVGYATTPSVVDTLSVVISPPKLTKEQRVLDALNKLDQPRISSLVTLTKLDKETLKKILPTLGYKVLHAGWVRKEEI